MSVNLTKFCNQSLPTLLCLILMASWSQAGFADSRLEAYLKGAKVEALTPVRSADNGSVTGPRRSEIPGKIEASYIELIKALGPMVESGDIEKSDIQSLVPIYTKFKANHLLLLGRFDDTRQKLEAIGANSQIVERQQSESERYLDLVGGLITALDGLVKWSESEDGNIFIQLWQSLVAFYYELRLDFSIDDVMEQVKKGQERPILHAIYDLPYRSLSLNSREPVISPEINPTYLQTDLASADADSLKSTEQAPLSELITEKASELDYDAIKIYEFVRNNIETEWYAGAMKGAENTLLQQAGNDADQASLLIALLRASSIPAQYVSGVINMPVSHIQDQTGIQNPNDVATYIRKAGYASNSIIQGGRVAELEIEYTWVSALIPYANYRGTQIDNRGKVWVPLAPAYKAYSGERAEDLISQYGVDLAALGTTYLTSQQIQSPLTSIQQTLEQALVVAGENPQLTEHQSRQQIVEENLDYLPNSLPMAVVAVTGEEADLSDAQQQWLNIQIQDENQNVILQTRASVASLESRRVTLSYMPETLDDQNLLLAFGGIANAPAYLVSLRPQIKVEGKLLAVANAGVPMGSFHELSIAVESPAGSQTFDRTLLSGSYHAIAVTGQPHEVSYDATQQTPADTEHLGARLMAQIALRYGQDWMQSEQALAELNSISLIRAMPAVSFASNTYAKETILNVVHSVIWQSVSLDAIYKATDTVVNDVADSSSQTLQQKSSQWMQTSALQGSYLEHKNFENDFAVLAMSADQGLAIATESGDTIQVITSANENLIALLNQDDNIKDNVQAWVDKGYQVTIPQNPISKGDWTGASWQVLELSSGAAGYLISGSLAGGETAESEWGDAASQNAIRYLDNGVADEDSIVGGIYFVRAFGVEDPRSQSVKGKPEQEVQVQVRVVNLAGLPMEGVTVDYEIVDGGGTLSVDNPLVDNITDAGGNVWLDYQFGVDVNVGRQFYFQEEGEDFLQLVGISRADISVTQRDDTFSIADGVEFVLFPGEPEAIEGQDITIDLDNTPFATYQPWFNYGSTMIVGVKDLHGNPVANREVTVSYDLGHDGENYSVLYSGVEYIYETGFKVNAVPGGSIIATIGDGIPRPLFSNIFYGDTLFKTGGIFDLRNCDASHYEMADCAEQALTLKTDSFGQVYVGEIWANTGFDSLVTFNEPVSGTEKEFKNSVAIIPPLGRLNSQSPIDFRGNRQIGAISRFWEPAPVFVEGVERSHAVLKGEQATQKGRLYIARPRPSYKNAGDAWDAPVFQTALFAIEFTARYWPIAMVDDYVAVDFQSFTPTSALADITSEGISGENDGILDLTFTAGDTLGEIEFTYDVSWKYRTHLFEHYHPQISPTVSGPLINDLTREAEVLDETLTGQVLSSNIWVVQPVVVDVTSSEVGDNNQAINGMKVDLTGLSVGTTSISLAILPVEFNPIQSYVELKDSDGQLIDTAAIKLDQTTYTIPPRLSVDTSKTYQLQYFVNDDKVFSAPKDIPLYQDIFISPRPGFAFNSHLRIDAANDEVCGAGGKDIRFTLTHKSKVTVVISDEFNEVTLVENQDYEKGTWTVTNDEASLPEGDYTITAVSSLDEHTEVREGTFGETVEFVDNTPIGHTYVEGVDTYDGSLSLSREDLSLQGRGPGMSFTRSYNSAGETTGVMGKGWSHNYSMMLVDEGCEGYRIVGGLGGARFSAEVEDVELVPGEIIRTVKSFSPKNGYHGSLEEGEESNTWDFYSVDGTRYHFKQYVFDKSGYSWHLAYIEDPWENRITLEYIEDEDFSPLIDPYLWDNSQVTKVTDSSGRELNFSYTVIGEPETKNGLNLNPDVTFKHLRLAGVSGPEGYSIGFEYDEEGSLSKATTQGAVETYDYQRYPFSIEGLTQEQWQREGRLIQLDDPRAYTTNYTYDIIQLRGKDKASVSNISRTGQGSMSIIVAEGVTSVTNFRGIPVVYNMDDYGSTTSQTVPSKSFTWTSDHQLATETLTGGVGIENLTTAYTYDVNGNTTSISLNGTQVMGATYSTSGFIKNLMDSQTDSAGNTTSFTYDRNKPLEIIYPEGVTESFSYANNGDLLNKTDRGGNQITYGYDEYGYLTSEIPDDCCSKTFEYNALGYLLSETNGNDQTITYTPNARGHLEGRIFGGVGSAETYTVDIVGNRLSETDFRGYTRTWGPYNIHNKPEAMTWDIGTQILSKAMSYDAHGNKLTESDWRGTTTTFVYNNNDHLESEFSDGDPATNITYVPDASGYATQINEGEGRIETFTYDALHNVLTSTNGEAGVVTSTYNGNNLLTREDRNGNITTFEYDGLNRVTSRTLPDNKGVFSFAYDGYGNVITEDLPDGTEIIRTYNQASQLESEEVVGERTRSNSYDDAGNLASSTDGRGDTTTYSGYDILGRASNINRPNPLGTITYDYDDSKGFDGTYSVTENRPNNSISTDYDGRGQVVEITDDIATVTEITRDANGNILSETDANDNETTRTYNSLNQIATENGPSGLLTTNTWDQFNNLIESIITDSVASSTLTFDFTYDNRNARLTESNSAGTTTWEYDDEGNVTSLEDKNGNETSYTYDGLNNPDSIQEPIGVNRDLTYDGLGRLVKDTDRKGIVTTFRYDGLGNQTRNTRAGVVMLKQNYDGESALASSEDANGNVTTYEYFADGFLKRINAPETSITRYLIDGVGNRTQEIDPENRISNFTYDARNRVLTENLPGGRDSTFTYDGNGNLLTKTMPEGATTTFTYNSLDQILTIDGPENTGLEYSYDERGNKTLYTDALNQSTSFDYDNLSRLTTINYPLGKTHGFTLYDANGNLKADTDPEGTSTTYSYDDLDRETQRTITPAAGFVNSVTNVSTAYDANNNVTSVVETGPNAGTASFSYDNFDRLTVATDQNGKTVNYSYDVNGNRTSLSSEHHATTGYEFDGLNRVERVTSDAGTTTYTYFRDSQLESINYPSGITAEYLYDGAGFLQSIDNKFSGSSVSSVSYSYDLNGNRTQQIQDNGFGAETTDYTYDDADRLTEEDRAEAGGANITTYTYDANYNRLTEVQTVNALATKDLTYLYNARDQLTNITNNLDGAQDIVYSYDDNGNRIDKTKGTEATQYIYNARNQITEVKVAGLTVATFYYDYQGMRLQKVGERGTENYVYDDQSVLYQTDDADILTAKFNYGPFQLLSLQENDYDPVEQENNLDPAQYYLFDGLGSPITLTNSAGTVSARYSYDAFGNKILDSGTSFNRFAFTGHEEDKETGLIYAKARFYDPDTGGFLTQDNFGGFDDLPPSLNKYLYAYANPTVFVDPDGNISIFITGATEGFQQNVKDTAKELLNFGADGLADDIQDSSDVREFAEKRVERVQENFQQSAIEGTAVTACGIVKPCKAAKKSIEVIGKKVADKLESLNGVVKEDGAGVITEPSRLLPAPKQSTPELAGAPIESDIIPAGTRFNQAVSPGQKDPGAFATSDEITDLDFVRDDLAVTPEFKPEVSGVREVEVVRDVRAQKSTVGPQEFEGVTHEGRASQIQFLEHDEDNPFLRFVGEEKEF